MKKQNKWKLDKIKGYLQHILMNMVQIIVVESN